MADLVPIPLALIDRLAQAVDIDAVFRQAELPRSRFRIGKPQGTTAEFFALWRAVEGMGAEADLGLRLGVETLTEYQDVSTLAVLHSPTLVQGVRLALSESMCGARPAMANIAKSIGMSPRTMQRRLGELGTTYQEVLDEVRRHSARRLLSNTDLEMGEISFLLGFEEVNSFMRAFQAWEGLRPPQWREKHAIRADARGASPSRPR